MPKPSVKTHFVETRPEAELLLCCARTRMDTETAERIRNWLRADIDWAYLVQIAFQHGVMPLLYRNLSTTCPEAVPKATLDELRNSFHANAGRNLVLAGELLKLLNLLSSHGIPAIPYKGPALAEFVYGDLTLRHFSDLDILVHKQDVMRAKDLLILKGYQPSKKLTGAQETALLQTRHHYHLVRDDGRGCVELHWAFTDGCFSFPLDIERLWERLESVSFVGTTVRNLPPEDLLLILCVHGSMHSWIRLEWMCDVAELIRVHPQMDWGRLMEQAGRLGSQRIFFLGLLVARDLLGTALPEEVLQMTQADPVVKSLATQVRERLFLETTALPRVFECLLFHFRARERLPDGVRSCLRLVMLPTGTDWAFLPLPAPLFPLYYLLRPIRLAGKYGLYLLKHLLNRLL